MSDIIAMGTAVQANLVQLKVAELKRTQSPPENHDIKVHSPGHVARFRDALIDYRKIKAYTDAELRLRIREIWGQYCLFAWALGLSNPNGQQDLASVAQAPPDTLPRCDAELDIKEAEIEAMLWALHFEQSNRHDPQFKNTTDYATKCAAAQRIPVNVFGKKPQNASDEQLLLTACEYAGMLAAIRWIADKNWTWNHPQIMTVRDLYTNETPSQNPLPSKGHPGGG